MLLLIKIQKLKGEVSTLAIHNREVGGPKWKTQIFKNLALNLLEAHIKHIKQLMGSYT